MILKIILLSGFLISLYGIHQYFLGFQETANYILDKNPYLYINHLVRNYLLSRRVFATFFSPNMLAGYLIVIIPVALGYILEFMAAKRFIPYIVSFVLCLALVLTKSLGAILSLAFSLILFSILLKPTRKISLKVLSFGLIVTLLSVTVIIAPIILARADRLFNFQNPHNSIVQRANFLHLTLKIIKEYPLWGVGMGNFGDFYMRHRGTWDIRTNYVHNFILQTQVEMGILGSLGLCLLLSAFIQDIISYIKKKKENYCFLKAGLLCAGISFLLHNLIDISFFIPEVAVFFWVSWASFKNLTKQKIRSLN